MSRLRTTTLGAVSGSVFAFIFLGVLILALGCAERRCIYYLDPMGEIWINTINPAGKFELVGEIWINTINPAGKFELLESSEVMVMP